MTLTLIESGSSAAATHMARDSHLLNALNEQKSCILHFYDWQNPCATFGYFCRPENLLNLENCKAYSLELARRPTGGGIIFHQFDLAFSVLLTATHPRYCFNTLESYRSIHSVVLRAITRFQNLIPKLLQQETVPTSGSCRHFCMAKPTIYDLLLGDRKVAGGAQRRTKQGILHQGTIALTMPTKNFLADILLPDSKVIDAMQRHSYPLLGAMACLDEMAQARQRLKLFLKEEFAAFAEMD